MGLIAVAIDAKGYEHKLIVFDKVDPRRRKITFRIKVESGELGVGFRPVDLAPHDLQFKKKLKPGAAVEVKIWIEGDRPTGRLDGQEIAFEGDGSNLGWVSLMPSRACRFTIQQVSATGR